MIPPQLIFSQKIIIYFKFNSSTIASSKLQIPLTLHMVETVIDRLSNDAIINGNLLEKNSKICSKYLEANFFNRPPH